ncbi:MAG TPA: excisionase family DNA-binding protein [Gemmatirosa sp.]
MSMLKTPDTEYLEIYDPTEGGDRAQAAAAARSLEHLSHDAPVCFTDGDGASVEIPPVALRMLQAFLRQVARGKSAVLVGSGSPEISTAEAAEILGVSRPHVVKLVDLGVLPSTKTSDAAGAHRRLRLSDVLAYRAERRARRKGLAELQQLTADMGGYDELIEGGALRSDAEVARMLRDGSGEPSTD